MIDAASHTFHNGTGISHAMSLLPDTHKLGLRMRREWWERFPRHRGIAIPTCITARTCRVACRGR